MPIDVINRHLFLFLYISTNPADIRLSSFLGFYLVARTKPKRCDCATFAFTVFGMAWRTFNWILKVKLTTIELRPGYHSKGASCYWDFPNPVTPTSFISNPTLPLNKMTSSQGNSVMRV